MHICVSLCKKRKRLHIYSYVFATCVWICMQNICIRVFVAYVCHEWVCVHVALSDLPPGLYGPNQMVGNINFTIPSPPPSPPLSSSNFFSILALLPSSSSPPSLLPSSVSCFLWRCDYVPPLSTSDLRALCVCVAICMCTCVCVWWLVGDLSSPALGIVRRNSRTTSPDECLHSQLQPLH